MSDYEMAQLNIGIIKGPMDSAVVAEFAANPDRPNALAESSAASYGGCGLPRAMPRRSGLARTRTCSSTLQLRR